MKIAVSFRIHYRTPLTLNFLNHIQIITYIVSKSLLASSKDLAAVDYYTRLARMWF